jgi:hypothetical protein
MNAERMIREAGKMRYTGALSVEDVLRGSAAPFIALVRHAVLGFSPDVADLAVSRECALAGSTGRKFIECAWRFVKEELAYRPSLSAEQFCADGAFAERKCITVTDIARLCRAKHDQLHRPHDHAKPAARIEAVRPAVSVVRAAVPAPAPALPLAPPAQEVVAAVEQSTLVVVVDGLRQAVDAISQRMARLEELVATSFEAVDARIADVSGRVARLEQQRASQPQPTQPTQPTEEHSETVVPPVTAVDTEQFITWMSQRTAMTRELFASHISPSAGGGANAQP